MPTQDNPLSAFFSSYNFNRYQYDPTNTPTDEFQRLCTARQWGEEKKNENFVKFLVALVGESFSNSPVAIFFRKYEFSQFTHNPLADPVAEFERLQAARKWGERKLKGVRGEFLAALESKNAAAEPTGRVILHRLPIVEFLKKEEFSGYTYRPGRPEKEFKRLVDAHRRIWEAAERRARRVVTGDEGWKRWRASLKFTELQDGFYKAVEEQFDLMLDIIIGETGLRRDEVMVELYGVGKAPLSEAEAETALESVHVNIFDFLDLVGETINTATDHEKKNLIPILSPGALELNFPDDAMLAIYSKCTGRVFPRHRAKSDGTLILLLRFIKRYFKKFDHDFERFKMEGGRELAIARQQEDPGAVRKLLLSREWVSLEGVRAIPAMTLAKLRLSRLNESRIPVGT